jgi:putative transposase
MEIEKFQKKYRIPSTRLQNWDYGMNAAYFVTICSKNRDFYFGKIVGKKMELSEIGKIAQQYWNEIHNHFPFIELGKFVVMPNHVHGIIVIDKSNNDNKNIHANDNGHVETPNLGVSTTNPNRNRTIPASQKWTPASLGVIINQYKRIVTINARKINPNFAWQSRFHDHIIRNNMEFERIQNYIINNPIKWTDDDLFV